MLRTATVQDLTGSRVSREQGYVVVVMRRYPRGVKKLLMDKYATSLAPDEALLTDFLETRRSLAGSHNAAFEAVQYEERLHLSAEGLEDLAQLSEMSRVQDVFLVCQCRRDQRCHRDLLLLLAQARHGAEIEKLRFAYPRFLELNA